MRDAQQQVGAPLLIVSSDGHITPPPAAVGQYLEAGYREPWLAQYHEENEEWLSGLSYLVFSDDVLELIDKEHRIRTQGDLGWEFDRRLREMDDEGIAAELLLAGVFAAAAPFFTCANREYPADVRWAGIRAYHRWVEIYYPDRGFVFSDPSSSINGVDARYIPFGQRTLVRPRGLALTQLEASGYLDYPVVRLPEATLRVRPAGGSR